MALAMGLSNQPDGRSRAIADQNDSAIERDGGSDSYVPRKSWLAVRRSPHRAASSLIMPGESPPESEGKAESVEGRSIGSSR